MVVELLVDPCRGSLTEPGVLADSAFVVESDCHPGDFTHPQRQPVAVVHRVAESADCRAEFRRYPDPPDQIIISERSYSAHGVIVRRAVSARADADSHCEGILRAILRLLARVWLRGGDLELRLSCAVA